MNLPDPSVIWICFFISSQSQNQTWRSCIQLLCSTCLEQTPRKPQRDFPPSPFLSSMMVDLFLNQVLIENNSDQDELNTEREIIGILENRILLLFFASAKCEKCQMFAPVLNDFFKRLKDPAYIEYPKLLALIYISLDQSEEQQERFLKEVHKKALFLAFEDPYRLELQAMFKVKEVPTVVVLRPDGSVISPNAWQDISHLGTDCFRNWQESAELIERTFVLNEEFDDLNLRSATDPVRRLKYKTEDDKRKKSWWKLWEKGKTGKEEEEKAETWDMSKKDKGTCRRR